MHLPKTACLLRTSLPREPWNCTGYNGEEVSPSPEGSVAQLERPSEGNILAQVLSFLPIKWSEGITRVTSASEASLWVWICPLKEETVQSLSCVWFCSPMIDSMPVLPVHHQLPELAQTHVNWVGDAIQPSHPLSSPSPPAFHLSQHQGLFQWVSSLHQVAKGLELKLQLQSFQWIFRTDFL